MQIDKGFTDNWLQPTGAQERLMPQHAGCKRFVWNRALSIERARYRRGEKKQLGKYAMMKQLKPTKFGAYRRQAGSDSVTSPSPVRTKPPVRRTLRVSRTQSPR